VNRVVKRGDAMNAHFMRVVDSLCDPCKLCGAEAILFDGVDFHGNVDLDPNAPQRKTVFPISGIPIYYWKCGGCGLVYTRAFDAFGAADFKKIVYDQSWRGQPAFMKRS
jgi:ferredoxin